MKNRFSYFKFIFKYNKISLISLSINLLILIYALIVFLCDAFSHFYIIILILPFIDILWQCYSLSSDFKHHFFCKYQTSKNELNVNYSDFVDNSNHIEKISNNTVSYNFNMCNLIRKNDFPCIIDDQATLKVNSYIKTNYDILFPFLYKHFKDIMKSGINFTNDKKLCLVDEIIPGRKVRFCKGSYYNTYLTNKIFTQKLISDDAPDIYPPYGCQNNNVRLPYEFFSNEIGVSTLAITSDGYLFFQRQGTKADNSPGLLVPSGSGSADWKDYHKRDQFKDTISRATKRELSEETGYGGKHPDRIIKSSKVIGMFRWLNLGGKPEFVSITLMRIPLNEIHPQKSEQKSIINEMDRFMIKKSDGSIDSSELENCWNIMDKTECSIPLYMNLKILKQYIEENINDFSNFIQDSISQY